MTTCQVPGESCPQCAQADLRPYGNGSKWICPRCYFILPCCEGGEVLPAAAGRRPPADGPRRQADGPWPPAGGPRPPADGQRPRHAS